MAKVLMVLVGIVMIKVPDNTRKLLQALYYIQSKTPSSNEDRFNKVYLLKMIYFADRYHLRHFGFLATKDKYYAMNLGPVASATFDILKKHLEEYSSDVEEISENDVFVKEQGEDYLSESFKEALNFALREFGIYKGLVLSDISHCYPEWKKHEKELSHFVRRADMSELDFFDDPENEKDLAKFNKNADPFKEDKDFLALMKEDFNENFISSRSA